MTPEERDAFEVGTRIAWGGYWNEKPTDPTAKIRDIARRAIIKDAKRKPKSRRPKVATIATIVGGLFLFALAGCIPVPTDVNIGDPLRVDNEQQPGTCQEDDPCWDCSTMGNHVCGPVVVETITLTGCHDPAGYSFTYIGPIDGAPYQYCGLPPILQKPAK